jgi:hypothetical protein
MKCEEKSQRRDAPDVTELGSTNGLKPNTNGREQRSTNGLKPNTNGSEKRSTNGMNRSLAEVKREAQTE